jgi:hypothetical protein
LGFWREYVHLPVRLHRLLSRGVVRILLGMCLLSRKRTRGL